MTSDPSPTGASLRRNALANVAGRSVSAVLWLLVTPFALAHLGAERFAVWSLFFVFSGYVTVLDFGMANGVARYVALAIARADRAGLLVVLRRSMALSLGLGLTWSVACILLRGVLVRAFHVPPALVPEVTRSLFLFGGSLFGFVLVQVLSGALMGFQRLDLSNVCFLAGLLVHAVVLVVSLALGAGLVGAAAASVSGQVVAGLLSAWLLAGLLRRLPSGAAHAPVTWKDLLAFGGATQTTAAFGNGHLQAGKLLLGVLGRLEWVTQFELGFRVANAVWSVPQLIQGAVIPAAAHASARGLDQVRMVYGWACRWIFALAGLVLGGLWLTAPALIVAWLGPGHDPSVVTCRGITLAVAIATLAGPATAVSRGAGWPWLETANFGIALVVNLLVCLWAVPRYGPAGAALALGVGYLAGALWLLVALHRRLGISQRGWIARVLAPRALVPAAVAAALALVWPSRVLHGRTDALVQLVLEGAAYTTLVVLLTWPFGDPPRVWEIVATRLRRRMPVGVAADGSVPLGSTPRESTPLEDDPTARVEGRTS